MRPYQLNHLQTLESEAMYILREVVTQCDRPVMLFSGGKDSICMAHLARKAFYPGKIPFPFMHVDTGHNFPETIEFRDRFIKELDVRLIIAHVQDSINSGRVTEETGPHASRNALQTLTLLDALKKYNCDAALGGARRDEEKSRAKERFFSFRNRFGQWDPKNQRPELWNLFNAQKQKGEHFRVFPISNWTELDIWSYIALENIAIPGLYFAHNRRVLIRDGIILGDSEIITKLPGEHSVEARVRFRTIGDMTCTGAIRSSASSVEDIIAEIASTRTTERGSRTDDKRSEAAMEDRKKAGYF